MEPEDGYGDSITEGIEIFGKGEHENLDELKQWDADLRKKCDIGQGVIEFKNVKAKYMNSKEDVLKGVSISI
jgi:ABC-type bacteriocin/lantibiotic exporter with double-glycine peptidase domain